MTDILDKIRGCMLGGAVGDALGYAVEFNTDKEIRAKYGESGITRYELVRGKAHISDDTQLTMFTANGLLAGYTRGRMRGVMGRWESYVHEAYLEWMETQEKFYEEGAAHKCWIMNHKELYSRRAPGTTCMSALHQGKMGILDEPINESKGCGGVMRVAPVSAYMYKHLGSIKQVDMLGARVAAITHGHPLGYIPAAMNAHIIARCVNGDEKLEDIIDEALKVIGELFAKERCIEEFLTLIRRAVELAGTATDDLAAIRELGEGWVAEETEAIAVYCALKYQDDFAKAVITAVNHDGDSDSTGAVTGNILGAYLGIDAIPQEYLENLEFRDVLEELAMDMHHDCRMSEHSEYQDDKWIEKYVKASYKTTV